MSTVNRAFIRAYAKEAPVLESASSTVVEPVAENPSPYAPLPPVRKGPPKFRADASLTPWGSGGAALPLAPVETVPVVEQPEPAFVPKLLQEPLVLSTSKQTLPELKNRVIKSPGLPQTVASPAPPVEAVAPSWEPLNCFTQLPETKTLSVGEYVCISGTTFPTDVQLALSPPAVEYIDLVGEQPSVQPTAQPTARSKNKPLETPPAQPIPQPSHNEAKVFESPVIEIELTDKFEYPTWPTVPQVAPSPFVAQPTVAAVEDTKLEDTKHETSAAVVATEAASATKPEMEVLWEVDRYLFPPMTDRLLRNYAYFTQAGAKLKHAAEAGLKVLGITGIDRAEGRTTLAICLARAAAQSGMRVGLVDCDFENPSLAMNLGLEIDQGWRHILAGKVSLQEVAIRSVEEGITLFPLTAKDARSGLSLLDPRVQTIIREAAEYVDLLILDLGVWHEAKIATETPLPFDAAIVVRDCRHHELNDVQPTAKLLQAAGVEAVGIAENFTAVG
jgi:Mrp family chromosome partitioning ATPase